MQMRNRVRASEQCPTDFASRGIPVSVKNARAAVCGFAREGELGAGAVELRAPLDELADVFGPLFDKQGNGFRAAKAVLARWCLVAG